MGHDAGMSSRRRDRPKDDPPGGPADAIPRRDASVSGVLGALPWSGPRGRLGREVADGLPAGGHHAVTDMVHDPSLPRFEAAP